jgi:hypothetical protein
MEYNIRFIFNVFFSEVADFDLHFTANNVVSNKSVQVNKTTFSFPSLHLQVITRAEWTCSQAASTHWSKQESDQKIFFSIGRMLSNILTVDYKYFSLPCGSLQENIFLSYFFTCLSVHLSLFNSLQIMFPSVLSHFTFYTYQLVSFLRLCL